MKRLDELTIQQFIDVLCGDLTILGGGTPEELMRHRGTLISEYGAIVDPAGTASKLITRSKETKLEAKIVMLRMCNNLMSIDGDTEVRDILITYGAKPEEGERLKAQVETMLRSAEFEYKRYNDKKGKGEKKEDVTDKSIRDSYASEIASLMSHFKMSIDTQSIRANVYANLIVQANREIKAKLAAMKKR